MDLGYAFSVGIKPRMSITNQSIIIRLLIATIY